MRGWARTAAALAVASSSAACDVIGPSCVARQKSGVVSAFSGTVEAGQIISVPLTYGPQGSQNDIHISWEGRLTLGGPRPQFFATGPDCVDFHPPPLEGRYEPNGSCTVIGGFGGSLAPEARECAHAQTCQPIHGEILIHNIILPKGANGLTDYKLHIVGDANRPAAYSVNVTWSSGPDC